MRIGKEVDDLLELDDTANSLESLLKLLGVVLREVLLQDLG